MTKLNNFTFGSDIEARNRRNERRRQLYREMAEANKNNINESRRVNREGAICKSSIKRQCVMTHNEDPSILKLVCFSRLSKIEQHPWSLPHVPSCVHCDAIRFYREPPGFCCSSGQVYLSPIYASDELRTLFFGSSQISLHFRANIRTYNNNFAFTSFGATYDKELCRNDKNVYTFKVQGLVYHFLNDLAPAGGPAKNLQLYFYDVENEIGNRLAISDKLNEDLILIVLKLLEGNPYSSFFRTLRYYSNLEEYKIVLRTDPGLDQRVYNIPTIHQVAAIWKDSDESDQSLPRDIRIHTKSGTSQKIEYYYGCYDPLQYVILFPRGEPGWHIHIKRKTASTTMNTPTMKFFCEGEHLVHPSVISSASQLLQAETKVSQTNSQKRGNVSAREYYCYRLQIRNDDKSILLHSGRLFQQYLNDMYIKVETQRLDYFRHEQRQKNARIESFQGVVDSLGIHGENDPNKIGQRIMLPSSFIGGPRDIHKRYMDAMTLVQKYGKPDFFMTMTCNPNWPEIISQKLEHELPQDRPDLLARAFKARLEELKDELMNKKIFGQIEAYTYVIEFQKRGLPHAHWLLIMKDRFKIKSSDAYDRFISAELPDQNKFPYLFGLVARHMMHGPCGHLNMNNICMRDGVCKNHYPKEFCEVTCHGKNSYPNYRRRQDGKTVLVRKKNLDNRWVVPYCPYLLAKFDCHINVEICSDIKLVKYLYKYIYKGHDRVAYNVVENNDNPTIDEIKQFQSGRWIAAPESAWRLFSFAMNEIHPSVISLQLHVPNYQYISFKSTQKLENVIIDKTEQRPVPTRFGTSTVQEFFIINDERTPMMLSLWNEVLFSEGQAILTTNEKMPIIAAIRVGISNYNGISLVARGFANIVLNASYPEAQSLRNWRARNRVYLAEVVEQKKYLQRLTHHTRTLRENYTTLVDIIANKVDDVYSAKVTVKIIDYEQRFWYMACSKCFKRTTADYLWPFFCNFCYGESVAKPRPKSAVALTDNTAQLEAMLFGESAESILGSNATELMKKDEENEKINCTAINTQLDGQEFNASIRKRTIETRYGKEYQYTILTLDKKNQSPAESEMEASSSTCHTTAGSSTVDDVPEPSNRSQLKK